ncbi:unnamed protein product [Fusarium langsethiae]|nr:unnamed protein product [Fusarium langsethiae]
MLNEFSRAVLFLALSVADPHDQATQRLKGMSESQILENLRSTLHTEFKRLHRYSQISLSTIGLIRHVLVQVGGPQNLAQINLLDDKSRDIHISSVFASLMGISRKNICSTQNAIGTLIEQLLHSQAFVESHVDWLLVTKMTQRLKLPFWVFVTSIPDEWTSRLSSNSWRSLRVLLNDASYLHRSLQQPYNAERLFSIWAYLVRRTYPDAKDQVQKSAKNICSGAIWSMTRAQATPAQMVLDLMTVLCISRLFPKETSSQKKSSSVEALDYLLKWNCRDDMLDPLNRLLVSLHRVLSADNFASRELNLARFISLVGLPNPLLELSDAYADQYFADRILNGSGHETAFANLCSRIGWFPIKLAPLNLSGKDS